MAMLATAQFTHAAAIMFTGSGISGASGSMLSASAEFTTSGSNLVITLTNTSNEDILVQPDILTAVFFDVSGGLLGLSSATGSAVVPLGSSVLFGGTDPGGVVGGEWGYGEGIGGALFGASGGALSQQYGISSAGFGVFGGATFPGSNLDPPAALDGLNYGITSAGDNPLTGQPAVTGSVPLIQNSVVFTLTGLPGGFDPSLRISNVWFQYGTALTPNDPGFIGIPVPAPGALCLLALAGLAGCRRSRG
jgi:hypothetical protein